MKASSLKAMMMTTKMRRVKDGAKSEGRDGALSVKPTKAISMKKTWT